MYVVTGATGHTGRVVVEELLAAGQDVCAIGRSADGLRDLAAAGAETQVCNLTDAETLAKAFQRARAVYVMVPPNITSSDYRAHQDRIVDALADALTSAGVEYAVSLSSVGAEKPQGTGPIVGQHYLERMLNRIDSLNVLHLRAGYFMENTLAQAGIIRSRGFAAGPLHPDLKVPMISTRDIGTVAARALLELKFDGKGTQELLGPRDLSMAEAARIIGRAIGKRDLAYVQLPQDQLRAALLQFGMSANVAELVLEMANAWNTGHLKALEPRSERNTTATSFETFAEEHFAD